MTKVSVKNYFKLDKTSGGESASRLQKPVLNKGKLVSNKSQASPTEKNVKSLESETAKGTADISKTMKRKKTPLESGTESKKQRLEAKQRKLTRKSAKNNHELITKAKKLWETVRRGDCPKAKQMELCVNLHSLIKGKVKQLIHAHDTSRVIECLVLLGSIDIRDALYKEIKGDLLSVMKSRYAKFFVIKMLKFGTKEHRGEIMKAMHGRITELVRHRIAASVVEFAYNEYANAKQRSNLIEEFYGAKYAVFKSDKANTLDAILNDNPNEREAVLKSMKESLAPVLEKSVISHSIIHRVIIEFLTHCNEKDRREMIDSVRDFVVEILHTKDGCRIGMQCIWHGTNKDRKLIIKSMKTHVAKICKEENGHMVLLSIFDSVDDTKLVVKALVEEMMKSAGELALDSNGRKVLMFLVVNRNPVYIHPDVIKIFEKGDENVTSKKDKDVRRKELLSAASPYLLKVVADNAEKLLRSPPAIILVKAVLAHCVGDPSEVFAKIAQVVAKPFACGDGSSHIIENAAVHMLFKHLFLLDKIRRDNGDNSVFFSDILLQNVKDSDLAQWIQYNRGTFTILIMLETGIPNVVARLRKAMQPITGRLEKKSFKGAELLLDALDKY